MPDNTCTDYTSDDEEFDKEFLGLLNELICSDDMPDYWKDFEDTNPDDEWDDPDYDYNYNDPEMEDFVDWSME